MLAVKFAPGRDDLIEGPGIPYGGPHSGKDLSGEFFTPQTELCLDWFNERPLLFHHGLDDDAQTTVVGRVKSWRKADMGVWTQAQLDRSNQYFSAIKDLVKKGKLFFSSGAMPHLVETNKSTGEIIRWPWVELSLTPTPCNLFATVDQVKSHYKSAGIAVPTKTASLAGMKAELSTDTRNNLDDSDFAYIDSDGGKHLPINDASHVRNALARFNQTHFESSSAKEKARKKIMAAARRYGIDVSDDSGKAVYFHHGDAVGRLLKQTGEYEESRDRLHWYKVVSEEDDAAGGNATEAEEVDEGSIGGMAHSMASHMHTHADGTTHAHAHAHMDGSAGHDGAAHMHSHDTGDGSETLFPTTGAEGKAVRHLRDMTDGDGDYAGSYEDLRDDLLALLNPTGPFQQGYTSIEATHKGYCIACTWDSADDGENERQFYRVDYSVGSDGEPTITKTTPVEQTYVPKEVKTFGPIIVDAMHSARASVALVERTQDLYLRRAKEGRTLTRAQIEAMSQTIEGWRASVKAFEELLEATSELGREQAKAERLQTPDGRKAALALHEHFAFALELERQGVS